jgi:hypothetical protein
MNVYLIGNTQKQRIDEFMYIFTRYNDGQKHTYYT